MVLGGHVAFCVGASSWLPLVEAGKLKILVAFGGKKRMFPDIPSYQELGYDFPSESLLIIIGPPNVPDPIVKKLHDAFKNAMEEPLYEEVLKKMNMQREYRSSEELKKYLGDFNTLWIGLLNNMGIKKKE
jgi:tripartite-type tricarboxylate transporter receptor subunit TctC